MLYAHMTGKSLAQTVTRIEKNTLDFLMTDLGLRETAECFVYLDNENQLSLRAVFMRLSCRTT